MIGRDTQFFISAVGTAAVREWRDRRICLPSLTIALALEGGIFFPHRRDGRGKRYKSVQDAVRSHNDYLATWKEGNQTQPNWLSLFGQEHYLLAVQYLQDAEYPYVSSRDFEGRLVELIESLRLEAYDEQPETGKKGFRLPE